MPVHVLCKLDQCSHRSLLFCREQHEDNEEPEEDEDTEFSPEKGNVAFASAHDGWAFRVGQFADLYEAKLGFKASALIRALWGDYRIDAKSKRIMRIKASQSGKYKPLFVQVTTSHYVQFDSNIALHLDVRAQPICLYHALRESAFKLHLSS